MNTLVVGKVWTVIESKDDRDNIFACFSNERDAEDLRDGLNSLPGDSTYSVKELQVRKSAKV